jgi:hypothetical protein
MPLTGEAKTRYQREYMRRYQRRRRAKLAQAAEPVPEPRPAVPEPDHALVQELTAAVQELTRQRDQARQNQLAIRPAHAGAVEHGACTRCQRRRGQVRVVLKVLLPDSTVYLCNECIEELRRGVAAAWIMGEGAVEEVTAQEAAL